MAAVRGRPYQTSTEQSLARSIKWQAAPAQLSASSNCCTMLPGRSKAATTAGSSKGPACAR
eukprot:7385396-Lingulodinium_polyedra.AAC.1